MYKTLIFGILTLFEWYMSIEMDIYSHGLLFSYTNHYQFRNTMKLAYKRKSKVISSPREGHGRK